MSHEVRVAQVMSYPVVTNGQDDLVEQAIELIIEKSVDCLPVTDRSGKLVGMLTEGDLLRRVETPQQRERPRWLKFVIGSANPGDSSNRLPARKVSAVMTTNVVTANLNTTLESIAALMARHRIRHIPIIDQNRLAGLVTHGDLLNSAAEAATSPDVISADRRVARELWATLHSMQSAVSRTIDIQVRDGIVDLRGIISDSAERKAIYRAARNMPGVKRVVDRLICIQRSSSGIIDRPTLTPG